MDELKFEDGPTEGSDPSLPLSLSQACGQTCANILEKPRGDGNDGDGKKANSKASAATSKTPGDRGDGDGDKAKSEAETSNTVLLEEPQTPGVGKDEESSAKSSVGSSGNLDTGVTQETEAVKETEAVNETEAGQQVSKPGFRKNEESMSTKSAGGSLGNLDKGATKPSIQAEDCDTGPYQQVAPHDRPMLEETDASQPQSLVVDLPTRSSELALKPPAQSSELARKGSLEIPGRQHPVVAFYLNLLERQEKKFDGLSHRMDEEHLEQAQHRREVKDFFKEVTKRKGEDEETIRLLKSDNIGLEQESAAEKHEKEQAQEKVDQLSKEIVDARATNGKLEQQLAACQQKREHAEQLLEKMGHTQKRLEKRSDAEKRERDKALRRLEEERDAKRSEKEELQECVERLKEERDEALEANKRMKKEMDDMERQLEDLQEFVELFMEGKRLDQESFAEKLEHDLEASERRVQELQRKSDDDDETIKELRNFLAEALPFVPEKPAYLLDPFTGYAIVVSNAIFKKDVHGSLKLVDDATKSALHESTRLAKALTKYGFEVKPMKNPTRAVLIDALEKCDQRWEQENLVLIFIIAHGNSAGFEVANSGVISQREVAQVFQWRQRNGKPTILCMATCRGRAEGKLDLLPHELRHVSLVNAVRLGFKTSLEDNERFVAALVKIFQLGFPRSFLVGINEMGGDSYTELDSYTRLVQPLVLPASPAKNRTKEDKDETYKLLEKAFKYAS